MLGETPADNAAADGAMTEGDVAKWFVDGQAIKK